MQEEIMNIFVRDANEGVSAMRALLVELSDQPEREDILEQIYQSFHILNETCLFLELSKLQSITLHGASALDGLRSDRIQFTQRAGEKLSAMFDGIEDILLSLASSDEEGERDYSDLIREIQCMDEGIEREEQENILKDKHDAEALETLTGDPVNYELLGEVLESELEEEGVVGQDTEVQAPEEVVSKDDSIANLLAELDKGLEKHRSGVADTNHSSADSAEEAEDEIERLLRENSPESAPVAEPQDSPGDFDPSDLIAQVQAEQGSSQEQLAGDGHTEPSKPSYEELLEDNERLKRLVGEQALELDRLKRDV